MHSRNPELFYFSNGLRLIYQCNNSAPVVTTQVWVNSGSADETETQAGIAHVLEHMLFKGTGKYPGEKVARLVEEKGGEINAFTSFDQTVYHLTVASRYTGFGIDILSDMVQNPLILEEALESEKEVILEEIKRSFDAPGREISRLIFSTAFSGHPYSRPIIGLEKSVRKHSKKAVLRYFKRWYDPRNLIFIVIGNANLEKVINKIEISFKCRKVSSSSFRKTSNKILKPLKSVRHQLKSQRYPALVVKFKNINEALVDIAFPIPDINHPDTAHLDVLAAVLCQGDTSYLYYDIKFKKQLVNDINAYSYTPKDSGILLLSVSLNPEKIEIALVEIIKKLIQFKYITPSDEDMEKAKINILSDHIFQKETVDGQARKLGLYYSMSGKLDFEETYHKSVENCSPGRIRELAQRYIKLNKLNMAFILPDSFIDSGMFEKLKELVLSTFKNEEKHHLSHRRERSLIAGGKKTSEGSTGLIVHTLNSGVRIVLKKNPFVPVVAVRAAMLGGVRFETAKNNGTSALLARMFTMGTHTKSATKISNMIESRATSLAGYSGKNTFGLEGEFLSRYFDEGLELFADVLLNPSIPAKEFENEKNNMLEYVRIMEDNLSSYVFQLFSKNIFRVHPYRFHILGSRESLNELKREDLLAFHKMYTGRDNMFISVVGDIDIDRTVNRFESLLASVKKEKTTYPEVLQEKEIEEAIRFHHKIEEEQTHILYGFRGTTISGRDRYVIDVIQAILSGQGGRLFTELRDRLALAYSVFAASMEGIDPGYIAVYIACSPGKKNMAVKHLKIELDRLKDKKVSGRDPEIVNSITADDILKTCNKYFDHGKSVLTTLGQVV